MRSGIRRVPSGRLRRLHRQHRGQHVLFTRSTSLRDEPRRSPRRLCCDATERARHHEFIALQYGIREHKFLPEVQILGLAVAARWAYWRSWALYGSWRDGTSPCTARCTTLPPVGDMPMQNVTGYGAGAPYSNPWTSQT